MAIVLDHQPGPTGAEIEQDRRVRGLRVLVDVGQGFLDDAEERDRDRGRQRIFGGRAHLRLNRDSGRLLKLAAEIEHPLADLFLLHDDRP